MGIWVFTVTAMGNDEDAVIIGAMARAFWKVVDHFAAENSCSRCFPRPLPLSCACTQSANFLYHRKYRTLRQAPLRSGYKPVSSGMGK